MIQKLADKIRQTHAPVCIGLDPMLDYKIGRAHV